MTTRNPVFIWDSTVPANDLKSEDIKDWCRENCKQWVFQLERGSETGYLHYQMRYNLHEKARKPPLPVEWTAHYTPTNTSVAKGRKKFDYVIKADTRVEGPWSDQDQSYIPPDVPTELLAWQQRCVYRLAEQNDRQILFMEDQRGGAGKSKLIRWLIANHNGIYIPPTCENAQQMGGFFYAATRKDPSIERFVVIDCPRFSTRKTWEKLAMVIEQIKDGYACDGRNVARVTLVRQPRVLVALNGLPEGIELEQLFTFDKIVRWNDFAD